MNAYPQPLGRILAQFADDGVDPGPKRHASGRARYQSKHHATD
jgi:hypothetical protein